MKQFKWGTQNDSQDLCHHRGIRSFYVSPLGADQPGDIREKVNDGVGIPSATTEIDPDKHVFGIPYGTTEDQVIAKHGKPDGYLRLNKNSTVMIFGKDVALLFKANQLDGVRINHSIIDWELSQEMQSLSPFNGVKWRLSNSIKEGMALAKVKEILGDKLQNNRHRRQYETEVAVVTLSFSH